MENSIVNSEVTVKAEVSNNKNATSGRILINTENFTKSIPAVIFSPEDAEELLRIAERVYHLDDNH
jgi:hypothetical protein